MPSATAVSRGLRAGTACTALAIRYLESLAQGQAGWNARALLDANGYRTAFQVTFRDFYSAIEASVAAVGQRTPRAPAVGVGFDSATHDAMRFVLLQNLSDAARSAILAMPPTETALGAWFTTSGVGGYVDPWSVLAEAVLQLGVYTGPNVATEASAWAFGYVNQLSLPGPVQDPRTTNPIPGPTSGPIDPPPPPPGVTTTPPQVPANPSEPQRHVAGSSFFLIGRTGWQKFPLWAVLLGVGFGTAGLSMLWLKYRGSKGRRRPARRRRQ